MNAMLMKIIYNKNRNRWGKYKNGNNGAFSIFVQHF